jgi:putative inorganic carbon (hco3(-)) transporter
VNHLLAALPLLGLGVGALAAGLLVWHVDAAWTVSAAVFLSPFSHNWPRLGIPSAAAPDRTLLVAGLVVALLRGPAVRAWRAPPGRVWILALPAAYVLLSCLAVGTISDRTAFFNMLESFGLLPFLAFVLAPTIFASTKQRSILLGFLFVLAIYLSATAIFETAGPRALVFPRYILDPNYGGAATFGRARGPFVEAVTDGFAMFACSIAMVTAMTIWKSRLARVSALVVAVACVVGAFLTLQRSVWIMEVSVGLVMLVGVRRLRRWLVPVVAAAAIAVVVLNFSAPSVIHRADERRVDQGPIWDRQNLSVAAINMTEARPLFGFGWGTFLARSGDYFRQSPDYPLTATDVVVHNLFLSYAADLGLVGLSIYLLAAICCISPMLFRRGPPELYAWRVALVALVLSFLVVMSFVPPSVFPNLFVWLWAGVVLSGEAARGSVAPVLEAPVVRAEPAVV